TSNVHDWELDAKEQQGKLVAELADGQLVKLTQLDFTVKAESLKSGKNGMDKNTFKALNTDKHKQITYKMNKVNNIDCVTTGNCKVTSRGTLTIAGTAKRIDITFHAKVAADKIALTGSNTVTVSDLQ